MYIHHTLPACPPARQSSSILHRVGKYFTRPCTREERRQARSFEPSSLVSHAPPPTSPLRLYDICATLDVHRSPHHNHKAQCLPLSVLCAANDAQPPQSSPSCMHLALPELAPIAFDKCGHTAPQLRYEHMKLRCLLLLVEPCRTAQFHLNGSHDRALLSTSPYRSLVK